MILASREQSSMVSTWTEYLCLQQDESGGYKLFTGRYEALAECKQFFNEETGECDIPEEINGQQVVGVDDDYVVGGELGCFDNEQVVFSKSLDDKVVATWLQASGWSGMFDVANIRTSLQKI
jgi:hypothetical protein